MKQRIRVEIIVPQHSTPGEFKTVYQMETFVDDSVSFDFCSVLKGLRCLYPETSIISFKVMP